MQVPSTAVRAGLIAAIAGPVCYYGAQAVAIPFYPGYSILTDSASMLGSDFAVIPQILNIGALLTGIAIIVGALAIHVALRALGAWLVLTWLTTLAILAVGGSALWASIYHMPDPRHSGPMFLGVGMILLPLLLVATFLPVKNARGMKIYLILNLLAFAAMALFVAGIIEYDKAHFSGLVQRFFSLTVFLPIGILGAFLLRRYPPATIKANA